MLVIPLSPVARQIVNVTLSGQSCTLEIFQVVTGMYIDVYVNNAPIVTGVICQNANRIVRNTYLGFVGDLAFFDTEGDADPEYGGLGSRWFLGYLSEADL